MRSLPTTSLHLNHHGPGALQKGSPWMGYPQMNSAADRSTDKISTDGIRVAEINMDHASMGGISMDQISGGGISVDQTSMGWDPGGWDLCGPHLCGRRSP